MVKSWNKVLIVDDSAEDRELAAIAIKKEHKNAVIEFCSGYDEFIEKHSLPGFHCIITDYNLIVGNGAKILKFMRDSRIQVPCVLMSGVLSRPVLAASITGGFDGFLIKDPEFKELTRQITLAVENFKPSANKIVTENFKSFICDAKCELDKWTEKMTKK